MTEEMTLKLGKTTKGTHVYVDDSDSASIPSVYIKKFALPPKPPKTIKITLSYD